MRKRKAESFFVTAMGYVDKARPDELHWARGIKPFNAMTLKDFLSHYCWVVYTSGFRVSIIEKKFDEIEKAFKGFDIEKMSRIRSLGPVLRIFHNEKKASGFLKGAMLIRKEGFSKFKERVIKQGVKALEELPGIGRITKKHLARNIGVSDVAKDDVHIRKLVTIFVARDEKELVNHLSQKFVEKRGVIDAVLWRFCADRVWKKRGYDSLESFCEGL